MQEQASPIKGFWSITMHEIDQGWWFVPNPLNRFTVSMRNNPKFNADGSLTLHSQNESPGKGKESNWLPAPKGDFLLTMRMYWRNGKAPSILDGTRQSLALRTGGAFLLFGAVDAQQAPAASPGEA